MLITSIYENDIDYDFSYSGNYSDDCGYDKSDFEYFNCTPDDLEKARDYVSTKNRSRYYLGVDYDEDNKIYNSFPNGVQNALTMMCVCGEID